MSTSRLGFAGILLGMTASVLMQTLLATAMPQITADLGGLGLYSWVFGAYMLASTVTLPIFGQLADRHGRRQVYLAGLTLYLVGTALAIITPSMTWLVACRIIQGLGAGAIVPAALAAVTDLFHGSGQGRAFGVIGIVQVVANILGPMIGAAFTDSVGWRWGLLAVIPVGVAAGLFAWRGLPAAPGKPWTRWWRHLELTAPLRLLASPTARRVTGMSFLLGVALMSATAYLPLLIQGSLGRDATATGAVLVPMMVAAGVGSGLGGWSASWAPKPISIGAWSCIAASFALLAVISTGHTGNGLAWPAVSAALAGLGTGVLGPLLLVDIQAETNKAQAASASGMVQLGRNLGGALGTPALGMWITALPLATALRNVFACSALVALTGLGAGLLVRRTSKGHA